MNATSYPIYIAILKPMVWKPRVYGSLTWAVFFVSACFSASFLAHNIEVSNVNCHRSGPYVLFQILFSAKERRLQSAFRLHTRVRIACELSRWSAQDDSKINPRNKKHSKNFLFPRNQKIIKRQPLGRGYFSLASLGRPLAHHGCCIPISHRTNRPKSIPGRAQE